MLHQSPHRPPVRGKLGGDIDQQPLPLDETIFQVRPHVCEAKLSHPRADTLLGVAASLQRQPLGPWLVPVVTLPAGTTVDSLGVKQALARSFATVARTARARAVSYGDTADRRFVSSDGRATFGLVFLPGSFAPNAPDLGPTVAQALQRSLPAGATVHVTGLDELASSGSSGNQDKSVLAETLLGGVGALAVLAFVFGSLLALMPLLIAAVSILTALLVILGLTTFTEGRSSCNISWP